MAHTPVPQALALLLISALSASSALAQQSTVHIGNGTVVRADADSDSTVRINGKVVNSASGPGATAETNIGSRSVTSRTKGSGQTTVSIESRDGSSVTEVTTQSNTVPTGHGKGRAAGGRDFVNADLSGRNFARANLAGRRFVNVDLSRANLEGADLRNAELVNVDLAGANLSGANLSGARLVNTDVREARTDGMVWDGPR